MRADIEFTHSRFMGIAFVAIIAIVTLTNQRCAMAAAPHHQFLKGPWELVVKIGLEGEALRFPLKVSDENKSQKLDRILPVAGTPIKIRLEQYIPDLKWETTAVNHPGEGIIARLKIKQKDSLADIWLSSTDPLRQSISSEIGGVAIKKFYNPNTVKKLLEELSRPRAIGVLSIWFDDCNLPHEYVVRPAETITMPTSQYCLSILEYMPDFLIDTETGKASSRSGEPSNPAIKVSVSDGEKTYEQWLWARFPSSPHQQSKLPLRMRFTDFDLGDTKGKYILVVAHGSEPWLLFSEKGKTRVEKAIGGQSYPFADKEYSFAVGEVIDGAIIKTDWKNNSQKLLHPALIVTIEQNNMKSQAVLEFDKPYHHHDKFGTMVILYRRRP